MRHFLVIFKHYKLRPYLVLQFSHQSPFLEAPFVGTMHYCGFIVKTKSAKIGY